MSDEVLKRFDCELVRKENLNKLPPDPLWEASVKFDKIYEEQLKNAEKHFMASISPVIRLVEKTANVIEEKEGILWLKTQSRFPSWEEDELKKTTKFKVNVIGHHGDECYPEWEKTGKFVQNVENGQSILDQIQGVQLEYRYPGIYFGIEALKDTQGKVSSVTLHHVTQDPKTQNLVLLSDSISINNANLSMLIDKLTDMVTFKEYDDNRPCRTGIESGWTIN